VEKRFRPIFIESSTLDDCWHRLLWEARDKGRRYHIDSGSYEGQDRVALDFAAGFIHYPHERPLAPRMPESGTLPPPTTDEEIGNYFANYLMDIKLQQNEHYRYSSWIVGGNKLCPVVQLDWIIAHLKDSPGNEHCYLTIADPLWLIRYDEPYKICDKCGRTFGRNYKQCTHCRIDLTAHEELRQTTPCLRGLDFRIIDGALLTHVIYRSWSLVAGWPTNMGGFTLLNEYVAGEIGIEPGPLSFSCKSLHLYSYELEYVNQRFCK